jgi:hypothetical protein
VFNMNISTTTDAGSRLVELERVIEAGLAATADTTTIPETVSKKRGRPPRYDYGICTALGMEGCHRTNRNHIRAVVVQKTLHAHGGAIRFPYLLPANGGIRTTVLLALYPFTDADRVCLADHVERLRRDERGRTRQFVTFINLMSRPRSPAPAA